MWRVTIQGKLLFEHHAFAKEVIFTTRLPVLPLNETCDINLEYKGKLITTWKLGQFMHSGNWKNLSQNGSGSEYVQMESLMSSSAHIYVREHPDKFKNVFVVSAKDEYGVLLEIQTLLVDYNLCLSKLIVSHIHQNHVLVALTSDVVKLKDAAQGELEVILGKKKNQREALQEKLSTLEEEIKETTTQLNLLKDNQNSYFLELLKIQEEFSDEKKEQVSTTGDITIVVCPRLRWNWS